MNESEQDRWLREQAYWMGHEDGYKQGVRCGEREGFASGIVAGFVFGAASVLLCLILVYLKFVK